MLHNVFNIALLAVGLASVIGCTETAMGFDCTKSLVGPQWGAYAALGFGALKLLINVSRDGLGGLTKTQPPVI